jgi:alpha-L-fucosidase
MRTVLLPLLIFLLVMQALHAAPETAAAEPAKDRRLAWWREARFGMFIHWGV